MSIDKIGQYYIAFPGGSDDRENFIKVSITMYEPNIIVNFLKTNEPLPYRIENLTSYKVFYQQFLAIYSDDIPLI